MAHQHNPPNHINHINHSSDSVRIYLNYDLQLIFVIELIFKITFEINDDKSSVKTYNQKHHIMNQNNHLNQINHSSDSVRISEL